MSRIRMIASPVRAGVHPLRAAPAMGEHTDEVLHTAGYSDEQIAQLRALGALG